MYSGLRKVGEEVKEKNENLLAGERVRDRTFIGEGGGKVGRNVRETGGRR